MGDTPRGDPAGERAEAAEPNKVEYGNEVKEKFKKELKGELVEEFLQELRSEFRE